MHTEHALSARGRRLSQEVREHISERNAERWQDPDFRANVIARLRASWKQRGGRSADDRARIGERSRAMWSDPAFAARMRRQFRLGWELRRERLAKSENAQPVRGPLSRSSRSHGPDVPLHGSSVD